MKLYRLEDLLQGVDSVKALSITEPYPTLIMLGDKRIETRPWKTNYRGTILIHASKTRNRKFLCNADLMDRAGALHFGSIVAVADLVGCDLMTAESVESMRCLNPREFSAGFYSPGRYEWILDNVRPVEPVSVKGQLGLWTFNTSNLKKGV